MLRVPGIINTPQTRSAFSLDAALPRHVRDQRVETLSNRSRLLADFHDGGLSALSWDCGFQLGCGIREYGEEGHFSGLKVGEAEDHVADFGREFGE